MSTYRPYHRPTNRGIALVIVLAMLVLLSALLVAFMSTASTERASTAANAGVTTARQISDSTVSLVISQIREATSQSDDSIIWASQPGAIRTFGGKLKGRRSLLNGAYFDAFDKAAAGGDRTDRTFKLYSADEMTMDTADYESGDLGSEVDVINDWDRLQPKEGYVDLNEPILSVRRDKDPDGLTVEPRYPIIDPRAAYSDKEQPVTTAGEGIVEGFDAKISTDPTLKLVNGGSSVPYLPMPVKWLYILRDGTIGSVKSATAKNPIVGRTAFWTDDESCKLNLNTASEGTFWDTPTASSLQECGTIAGGPGNPALSYNEAALGFGASQPMKGEYQRYPGHPATTCLSPALGWIWGLNAKTPVWPQKQINGTLLYRDFKEAIYAISPFMPLGAPTSEGATKNTDGYYLDPSAPAGGAYYDKGSDSILAEVRNKHLFTSIDEAIFKSARFLTPDKAPALTDPKLTADKIEKVRFFLTANSRAPELNLFGRPRVTLWPIHADFDQRTQFDDLFSFTSTISKAADEADDIRYNILRYDAKDDVSDYNGAKLRGQNVKMYKYLQSLTSVPDLPGFGGNFDKKWRASGLAGGIERDEILNLIFDYTRTVNLVDTGSASRGGNDFIPYTPKFFIFPPGQNEGYGRIKRSIDWSGQVTPLKISDNSGGADLQGMGRFPTISEVALIFHGSTIKAVGPTPAKPAIQATLAFEMSTVMPGLPAIRDTYWTKVKTVRDVKVAFENGVFFDMGFRRGSPEAPLKVVNICNVSSHEVSFGRAFMPTLGFTNAMIWFPDHKKRTDPTKFSNPEADPYRNNSLALAVKDFENDRVESLDGKYVRGSTVKTYPYVSNRIPLPDPAKPGIFRFVGGRFEIEVWSGEAPPPQDGRDDLTFDERSRLVQTYIVDFSEVPVPADPTKSFSVPVIATSKEFRARLNTELDPSDPNSIFYFKKYILPNDVVRTMELTVGQPTPDINKATSAGDLRLAAARRIVPESFFSPRDGLNEYKGTRRIIHGLAVGHGDPVNEVSGVSKLVLNSSVRTDKPPILPRANGVVRSFDGGPGDWDRGLSKHMSGAFGNKVDEGNLRFNYSDSGAGRIPYFRGRSIEETGQSFFSPNRQLPSAVMLGSLPTGVARNFSWQTLLFRPDREMGGKSHPGAAQNGHPPDHLMLDLFTIPVVEPYAISEPFSTAGKVNLNYVIAPFGYARGGPGENPKTKNARSYIRRDTAVRGLLKSTFVMAVPTGTADGGHTENPYSNSKNFRYPIDLNVTMGALESRLKEKDTQLFRSASEICNVDLYPETQLIGQSAPTVLDWGTFWDRDNALTGDNMRERPYAHIYPRVTTKSNVFTVHMHCQAIRKSSTTPVDEFDEEKDQVIGDYRGSATIERFIDPNDPALKGYHPKGVVVPTEKVDQFYRYRVVGTKHFAPH